MKKALAKYSFIFFSTLIALKTYKLLHGETWPVCALGIMAAACAIWALAGLYNPRVLFFAHPTNQNREKAFFFSFKLFLVFAFCAFGKSVAEPGVDGTHITTYIGAFLLPFFVFNIRDLHYVPNHVSLGRSRDDFEDIRRDQERCSCCGRRHY